jgi:hypothetical protein
MISRRAIEGGLHHILHSARLCFGELLALALGRDPILVLVVLTHRRALTVIDVIAATMMVRMIGLFLTPNARLVLFALLALLMMTLIIFVEMLRLELPDFVLSYNSLLRTALPGGDTVVNQGMFVCAVRGHI